MANATQTMRERLVARRASPVVFFLDKSLQLRGTSERESELWDRYERSIVTLASIHRPALDAARGVTTVTPDTEYVVRLTQLSNEAGYVVLLEPFESRDPLRDLSERYALTPRERDVARLLLDGASTLEMAEALSIAPSTAVIHVKSILAKTGSKNRAAAVGRIVHRDGDGRSEGSARA